MSRYIDADQLIELIRSHERTVRSNNESVNSIYSLAHCHIIGLIEDIALKNAIKIEDKPKKRKKQEEQSNDGKKHENRKL